MIAQGSIQEVLNRADIIEIIGQFVRLKKRGANHIANCPFHSEKTPSFYVSGAKGIYKCFGCGKGGNVVTFIQDHEKLTYPESIRWLADYYKIALEETERTPEQVQQQQSEESLRILNDFAAKYFHETLLNTEEGQVIGLPYFKQRGFRKDIIEKFLLGYNPESNDTFSRHATQQGYNTELLEKAGLIKNRNGTYYDVYRGRVIFPIQSMTGRVLGFGARILKSNDRAPKYINTPENELYIKSRVLYGIYQSRQAIAKQDECFLVEGYTDVISLHQGGVENVVASSGTSLTEDQLRAIGQLTKNLTILYDGDAAGVKAALRGLDMALSQSFNVKLVLLPEGEDPDSFIQKSGAAKFHEYVKEKKQDVISFRLEVGLKEVGNDPVAKSKLVNEVAESISKINKAEDFALQDFYIRETSRKLQVEEAGLVNLVNKFIRDRVDQEKRQTKREEDIPNAETISSSEQLRSPLELSKGSEEHQEWELIRALIEHGEKEYEGYNNVADLIQQRVDPDLFGSALARQVYDSYFNYINAYQSLPQISYFINFPDQQVQQKMASLLHTRNEISPNWSNNYGIETLSGEFNYMNEADSALSYFELKKIMKMQDELADRFLSETDIHRITVMQQKIIELKRAENDIIRKHGTVVLKIAGKR
ncbi:MAG TPA: DNA primase [Flavipsychrobacter sp.]|nr:DNA primase [Flavipsychrobacter sp.]